MCLGVSARCWGQRPGVGGCRVWHGWRAPGELGVGRSACACSWSFPMAILRNANNNRNGNYSQGHTYITSRPPPIPHTHPSGPSSNAPNLAYHTRLPPSLALSLSPTHPYPPQHNTGRLLLSIVLLYSYFRSAILYLSPPSTSLFTLLYSTLHCSKTVQKRKPQKNKT